MSRRLTTEQFIGKAKFVHGDEYDYSKVVYTHSHSKVKIICKTHGEFEQIAKGHLQGDGCFKCKYLKFTSTIEQFIEKAKLVHGDLYDYSKVFYVGAKSKVKIVCKEHGEFEQTPRSHLKKQGCRKCSDLKRTSTAEQFIEKAKLVHCDLYDYSKVTYVNNKLKVKIICKIHGEFEQTANNHLRGTGCSTCSQEIGSWSRSDYVEMAKRHGGKANLYVVRCEKYGEVFYKIGITVKDIKTRFSGSQFPYHYDVVYRVEGDAEKIWNMEKMIHRWLKHLQYQPKLPFGGQTECFSELPESFHKYIGVRAVPRKQIHN